MIINPNTKIAALLKAHPDALEAIISINPKFEKLRNPIMRKLMAGRTSISMASKISGCGVQAFYDKLKPLGFEVDDKTEAAVEKKHSVPGFLHRLTDKDILVLDVRKTIEEDRDPLPDIMKAVKEIPQNGALKIINSFEPTPLIKLLEKQGFAAFVDDAQEDAVETWFYKEKGAADAPSVEVADTAREGWDNMLAKYEGRLEKTDVRAVPMPLPMHTILELIDTLPDDKALFVEHKRIPVFLLPELRERHFDYRIKEIEDGHVQLLIFKD